MAFVEEKLSGELSDFIPKNRQQVGYDREARRRGDGALVRLEIKGQKADQAVKLEGNEPSAARRANTEQRAILGLHRLWNTGKPASLGRRRRATGGRV